VKAINFLEWCNDRKPFVDKIHKGNYCEMDIEDIQQLNKLIDFYSQPFRPETIMELFEGWEKEDEHYIIKAGEFTPIRMIFVNTGHRGHTLVVGYKEFEIDTNWITLDNFITDYQRVVAECKVKVDTIELTFKKEIADKYF
jgi:hypothetical protein